MAHDAAQDRPVVPLQVLGFLGDRPRLQRRGGGRTGANMAARQSLRDGVDDMP
jgi:hypothetical protein